MVAPRLPLALLLDRVATGRHGPTLDGLGGTIFPAQAIRHVIGQHWPD
jgi:hypothetical protein